MSNGYMFSEQEINRVREEMLKDAQKLKTEEMQAHIKSGIKRKLVDLSGGPLFGGNNKQEGLF